MKVMPGSLLLSNDPITNVSHERAIEMLRMVRDYLFWDYVNQCWDEDKEWESDELEYIASVILPVLPEEQANDT